MTLPFGLPLIETVPLATSPPAADAVEVVVVRSARRRTLALHVSDGGRIEARVPLRVPAVEVERFVHEHRRWLLRKVAEFAGAPRWRPNWGEGGEWFVQGVPLRLVAGSARGVVQHGDSLALPLSALADPTRCRRRVVGWHKTETGNRLRARTEELFARHCAGDVLRGVEFRWMRATWGTCTARRLPTGARQATIRLNLWLGAVPPALADAVILHEIAHVAHMHHGAAFYRRLDALDPGRARHDEELKHWARLLFPVPLR